MSKLYGYLHGDSGNAQTKASTRVISAMVQTQSGRVGVTLNAHGDYQVSEYEGSPGTGYYNGREVASGNVNRGDGEHRTRARRGGGPLSLFSTRRR